MTVAVVPSRPLEIRATSFQAHQKRKASASSETSPAKAVAVNVAAATPGGGHGPGVRMSLLPPNRFRSHPFWPAGARADAADLGQLIDVHGEQNGAIYQQITLGRTDIAPVSLLAEDRADVLEFCINGKHGNHSSHLHPRHTARDAGPGQGLRSSLWPALLPLINQWGQIT
jgi:hypothetical protein